MSERRIELLKQFLQEDPGDSFTRFALATEYLKAEKEEEALNCFRELVASSPDYVGTYYHLGKLLEKREATEEAIQIYQEGIAIAQKQGDAHSRAELQDALMSAKGVGFDD